MQPTGNYKVPVGGKIPIGFSWHGEDLPDGVTILSATKTVLPASGLTVGTPVVNAAADGVSFFVEGVAAGSYTITVTALRSDGGRFVEDAVVMVGMAALSANALVTLDDARNLMGWIAGSHPEDDANLEVAIEAVSRLIRHKTNCDLVTAAVSYTAQKIDGSGSKYLYLPHWPVLTLASITEDDVLLVENTDYYQLDAGDIDKNQGILERAEGYRWTKTQRGILATYTAGYLIPPAATPTIPGDLKMACLMQAADLWKKLKDQSWSKTSQTLGGQTINFSEKELIPFVESTLKRYWREEWG